MSKKYTVEWAPFTLAPGITEEDLFEASNALQKDFLSKQEGFVKRELLKGKDNQWVDLVYWNSKEDAEKAAKAATDSPTCFKYFQLMVAVDHNDPSAGVFHFEQMKEWR